MLQVIIYFHLSCPELPEILNMGEIQLSQWSSNYTISPLGQGTFHSIYL